MGKTKGTDKALGEQDDGSAALAALAAGAEAEGAERAELIAATGETLGADALPAEEAAQPGEDHTTEFDRRLNTLFTIAEQAEFESGSLVGDIRDGLLDIIKHRPKPWANMSQDEQQDLAKALEAIAKSVIRKVVIVVAEQDEVSVTATLKGYGVKGDTFSLKAEAKGDEETAIQLFKLDGHEVVIISADAKRFMSQRKPVAIDPDQRALSFADDKPTTKAEPLFLVTTFEDGERLFLDADADQWGANPSEAGRWTEGEAGLLAKQHDAEAKAEDDFPF